MVILFAFLASCIFVNLPVEAVPGFNDEGYRIALDSKYALKNGLAIRNSFSNGKVTSHINLSQKKRLDEEGIQYEIVPLRTIVDPIIEKGKPAAGTTRAIPSSQIPYGIKMIYGNPSLTAKDISGGADVTIAVLDTGVVNHPDFIRPDGSKVIKQLVDFSQNKISQVEGTAQDGNGHGTHVTGTIAASGGSDGKGVYGVAPQANIFSYKVLNDRGSGYADDIAQAIRVAADRGANIISMSLGSAGSSSLELSAIQYAVSKGVLVVAAAGNSGPNPNTIDYPGAYAQVIGVAALNPDEIVSYFSSRGINDNNDALITDREVELAGPGRNVISTYKTGGYATMSGTSMATPHIAGLAAKVWQGSASATRNLLSTLAQNHDILTAENINNASAGYDIASGYGLPQVTPLIQSLWKN